MVRKRTPGPKKNSQKRARKAAPRKKARAAKTVRRKGKGPANPRRKTVRRKKLPPLEPDESRAADFDVASPPPGRGLGLEAGGQAGDTEGLSRGNLAVSESVEELAEEGQAFEAGVISGVEGAPDADEGEVRTREVLADDVPEEYLGED